MEEGRFGFQSHVPWHRCGFIMVLGLTITEIPVMRRKQSVNFTAKKYQKC